MATIDFVNNTLVTGTTFNPGLEDVLIPTGTISQHTATIFEITNNSGGAFDGFKFQIASTAANFTYSGTTPTAGTIGSVTVLAPNGTTHIINVTAGANGFGDASLANFFNTLKSAFGGVEDALDRILGNSNVVNGDGVADHLTAFGFGNNVLFGNNGNDVLTARFDATLVGGNGNDVIRVGDDNHFVVAGANLDGTGGAGQTNTLEDSRQFRRRPARLVRLDHQYRRTPLCRHQAAGGAERRRGGYGDRPSSEPDRKRSCLAPPRSRRLDDRLTAFRGQY